MITPIKKNIRYKVQASYIRFVSECVKYFYKITKQYPSSYPYLSGDSFRSLCTKTWDAETPHCHFQIKDIQNAELLYIATNHIREFFELFKNQSSNSFILISGNDDTNINDSFINLLPSSLYHWFAQNTLVKHEKITPIPIGLENRRLHWHGNIGDFTKLRKKTLLPENSYILYGFSVGNNKKEREPALRVLENLDCAYPSGYLNSYYYRRYVRQFGLVASPPGNGEDCHRTWEALYLGVAPIVKKSILTDYFASLDLPLVQIEDWEELYHMDELLRLQYAQKARYAVNHPALFMDYWIDKINKKRNDLLC